VVRERGCCMVGVPLRRSAPSYEQQPESHNGCDNTQDQEPDGPVTRCPGEEFRQARAQGGRGLHAKDDEHHTDNEQGHPNDTLHTSVLLRSVSIIRKETRRLLWVVSTTIIQLCCRGIRMPGCGDVRESKEAMEFFVPHTDTAADAEHLYEATKAFAKDTLQWPVSDRRIFRLQYTSPDFS
jgi:hypothetical protein